MEKITVVLGKSIVKGTSPNDFTEKYTEIFILLMIKTSKSFLHQPIKGTNPFILNVHTTAEVT